LPINRSNRVLIAEEEKPVADLFSLSLREMGCQVRVTQREAQIRDGIIHWKPDMLLLDLFLPGCSGLDLLREYKSLGINMGKPFPILVVSALGFREVVEQARELGAVDFILKPVDLENFRQKALLYLP
jgi:two-component system, NtrC family, nitrogen regulation response regulator NtrX